MLDQYDDAMLDERDYDGLDPGDRAAAEAAMADRDRREGRFRGRSRIAAALESDEGESASLKVGLVLLLCSELDCCADAVIPCFYSFPLFRLQRTTRTAAISAFENVRDSGEGSNKKKPAQKAVW